jgi:hypothetical protein
MLSAILPSRLETADPAARKAQAASTTQTVQTLRTEPFLFVAAAFSKDGLHRELTGLDYSLFGSPDQAPEHLRQASSRPKAHGASSLKVFNHEDKHLLDEQQKQPLTVKLSAFPERRDDVVGKESRFRRFAQDRACQVVQVADG